MSYTLNKTGVQIDAILDRAETGGEIDQELALKAPLASPALTGTPTAPTPADGDNSTKIATTEFVAAATAGAITDTAGPADVVTIPDGSDAEMLSFKASIEPLQSGTGTPSPDNVRPFTGWTGANGTVTGKNLLKKDYVDKDMAGLQWEVNDDGSIHVHGVTTGRSYFQPFRSENNFTLKAGTYTISLYATGTGVGKFVGGNAALDKSTGTYVRQVTSGIKYDTPKSFTLSAEDAEKFKFDFTIDIPASEVGSTIDMTIYPMIEVGSSVTDFVSYISTTYPIDWTDEAGTVYKGEVDFVSGVLTVTSQLYAYSGAGYNVQNHSSGNVYIALAGQSLFVPNSADFVTNIAKNNMNVPNVQGNLCSNGSAGVYFSHNDAFQDAAGFIAYATANPVQMLMPLATPQTYQLDPVAVRSLLGVNNCWTDTGETEIEYKADLKLYIDKKIAEAL